jgi:hypothetical protein
MPTTTWAMCYKAKAAHRKQVKALARRFRGELLANRCTTTWAGQTRFLSEAATRTN